MTVTVEFTDAAYQQLKAEANAAGKDIETVVREAVDAKLARRKKSFADALMPIHDAIEQSGMSGDEATTLLDDELRVMRAERRSARSKS
jgi:hypothetical protein